MEFVPVKVSNPITFEEAKEGHYRLWDYLAKTGYALKPTKAFDVLNGCYACEYARIRAGGCEFCPIYKVFCGRPGTLYYKWCHSSNKEERMKLAAKIRDLPWTDKSGLLTVTK